MVKAERGSWGEQYAHKGTAARAHLPYVCGTWPVARMVGFEEGLNLKGDRFSHSLGDFQVLQY